MSDYRRQSTILSDEARRSLKSDTQGATEMDYHPIVPEVSSQQSGMVRDTGIDSKDL